MTLIMLHVDLNFKASHCLWEFVNEGKQQKCQIWSTILKLELFPTFHD